ncbi:putative kinase [Pontibacter ummariensis]|uniref:Predicted kinase n=1 Tax=Pontibacter ummariensis TaxID=1610492 RepID=A0A239FS50_9BACT|nr:AAA family ATPase [Pontibacter ummariensis]PRY11956.1 putative kinase [Pontibacter ummariensis]SNS59428.1 Predicted kinase [Pontibacter ummariensis]
MQAIIFCGIQASGKSTYYKEHFFNSHMRISLDLLRTRNRERLFLEDCLRTKMRFVVDNTNPTIAERQNYISLAKAMRYEVIGYFFDSSVKEALLRNSQRSGRFLIPEKGIYGTQKRLQRPTMEEGYDQLYRVSLQADGGYLVQPLP